MKDSPVFGQSTQLVTAVAIILFYGCCGRVHGVLQDAEDEPNAFQRDQANLYGNNLDLLSDSEEFDKVHAVAAGYLVSPESLMEHRPTFPSSQVPIQRLQMSCSNNKILTSEHIKDISIAVDMTLEELEILASAFAKNKYATSSWEKASSLTNESYDVELIPLLPAVPLTESDDTSSHHFNDLTFEELEYDSGKSEAPKLEDILGRHLGMVQLYHAALDEVMLDQAMESVKELLYDLGKVHSELSKLEVYLFKALEVCGGSPQQINLKQILDAVYESTDFDGSTIRGMRTIRQSIKGLRRIRSIYLSILKNNYV